MLFLDLQLTAVTLTEQFDGLTLMYHAAARGNILAKCAMCFSRRMWMLSSRMEPFWFE